MNTINNILDNIQQTIKCEWIPPQTSQWHDINADTAFNQLTAAIAHEIKNPAAIALAHVNNLRKGHGAPEATAQINEICNHVELALEHICFLVQEMLFVTHGATPAYEFDIYDMLVFQMEEYRAAWPCINFTLDTGSNFVYPFFGEEIYVQMILSNLLKNAAEAINHDGHIEVSISEESSAGLTEIPSYGDYNNLEGKKTGYVLITIKNEGGEYHCKPHHSGLGLAICKWLAERLGGRVDLKNPKGGSCEARVYLPYRT